MKTEETLEEAASHTHSMQSVYVYEAPLRLWHWVNAACIVVLIATGYFIGHPLPSLAGEASDHYLMGLLRFLHFGAAYIFAIGFLGRLYWAFAGNVHARQVFMLPLFTARWWGEVLFELKWYFFLVNKPKKYVGHNPLARLMMFLFVIGGAVWMMLTGFALYSEGAGYSHWTDTLFGWVIPFAGGSLQVHMLHRAGMWATAVFVIIHVYAGVREDMVSRQSLVGTMVNGWRTFKD